MSAGTIVPMIALAAAAAAAREQKKQATAFVFPGQGAQSVGMGRSLYDNSAMARDVFHAIDEACGFGVSELCFSGSEADLRDTRNAQPALFAVSCAAWAACLEAEIMPAAVAGHSVGEYAALVAANAVDLVAGARLVKARSEAMAQSADLRAGTMAAVLGLDDASVAETCRMVNHVGVVVVANSNCPGQTVISGEVNAVNAACELLKRRGAKRVVPLAVSGAFHSPLMELAAATMHGVLDLTVMQPPQIAFVANVTADYAPTEYAIKTNLAAQVAGPVRWTETILRLTADGFTNFIECGPGNVLAGLIKRIAPDARTLNVNDWESLQKAQKEWLT